MSATDDTEFAPTSVRLVRDTTDDVVLLFKL